MKIEKKLPLDFNVDAYLDLNPDVALAKVDPIEHYLNYGIKEQRRFNYFNFKAADYNFKNYQIESEYYNKFSFFNPKRIDSAWQGHTYFSAFLISLLKPKIITELGVHLGFSYFYFCQVCELLKFYDSSYKCNIFGIDTFDGDDHASYEENKNVENFVFNINKKYEYFSKIIKDTFDNSLINFENNSIDLLHIDGQHYYEDVKNDFYSWLPKLSDKSVVFFHDIAVETRNFGVKKFWEEIKKKYKYLDFNHSSGLGVLFTGNSYDKKIDNLINFIESETNKKKIRDFYNNIYLLLNTSVDMYLIEDQKKKQFIKKDKSNSDKIKLCFISQELNQSNFTVRIKKQYDFLSSKFKNFEVDYFHPLFFDKDLIENYDIFIFNRLLYSEETFSLTNIILAKNKKIIYDLDDLLIESIPNFLQKSGNEFTIQMTKDLIRNSHLVTAGTDNLKNKLIKYNSNVEVIDNAVSKNDLYAGYQFDEIQNLILASTDTVDVSYIYEFLNLVLTDSKLTLNIVGPIDRQIKDNVKHSNIKYYSNMSLDDFLIFLESKLNAIGLIPLDKSVFSNCKTPIKYFHYTIKRIPVIATDTPPYSKIIKNNLNGYLANSTSEWISSFNQLKDKNNRKKIIDNSLEIIFDKFTYEKQASKLKNLIESLL